ncbi:hypothetical protein AZI86_09495 [Bdellovibrio bacteriovorus]|uniref:Histidine kinase/HSP90-like ATPase domain-containing protein n=1 Tax=Bdellovibrio bacteriovorus TaxID=959 RepID=A0A150WSH5_BDEBC|nr:hypothetical protein AZI86_09495 [Bdellovibrio bacteriovorus]
MLTAVIAAGVILKLGLDEPQFNPAFQVGDSVVSDSGSFQVEALDLLAEPGELATKAELRRFYLRQQEWRHILESPSAELVRKEVRQPLQKMHRKLKDLSAVFWIPLIVGLGTLIIGGWIWSLKPQDTAVRLFALSGFATFLSALPSSVYTSREGPLSENLFRVLETLNAWGAALFGIAVLALFLIYPVRLKHWKKVSLFEAAFFVLWTLGFSLQVVPDFANISLIIVSLMALICVAIAVQFFATKRDPAARASLVWLGLSVVLGAGGFVVFNTVPSLIGTTPFNQSYAFLSFLVIYLGLAAGLTRYRLFEVGQWAFRFLFYSAAAAIFIVFDLILISLVGLGQVAALEVSLLLVVFIYLPFRDFLWRKFTRSGKLDASHLLSDALAVAFALNSEERETRWLVFLKKTFDPLQVENFFGNIQKVEIIEDGVSLLIPSVSGMPAVKISYPWAGRGLFNRETENIATQFITLIHEAESGREAYDRGVQEERRRVAQDLHDDVGARLLSGLHSSDENLRTTIQGAMADIRAIISAVAGEKTSLKMFLEDLRFEVQSRTDISKITLNWNEQITEDHAKILLDYRVRKSLTSVLREVLSNVIRHSEANQLKVDVCYVDSKLTILLEDNGKGFDLDTTLNETRGYGLKGMQRRLQDIGTLHIQSFPAGTSVKISLPLSGPQTP